MIAFHSLKVRGKGPGHYLDEAMCVRPTRGGGFYGSNVDTTSRGMRISLNDPESLTYLCPKARHVACKVFCCGYSMNTYGEYQSILSKDY